MSFIKLTTVAVRYLSEYTTNIGECIKMQNRFIEAVSVEELREKINYATNLSESFTDVDKNELLKLSEDPTLPMRYTVAENASYAQYHETLRKGSITGASESEQHIAKIYFAALALPLLSADVRKITIDRVIYNREKCRLTLLFSVSDRAAFYLSKILPITAITELDFSDNQIGNDGAKALSRVQTLTSLNLSMNQVRFEGVKALAENTSLLDLNLSDNQLDDDCAAVLAENKTLTSLDLSNNNIGNAGAKSLAKNTKIQTLRLSSNPSLRDEGAVAFKSNQSLTYLDLSRCAVGDATAIALAANNKIKYLDLSINGLIGPEGAKALAPKKELTALAINACIIGPEGAKALASNPRIESLRADQNSLEVEGERALAETNPTTRYNLGVSVGVKPEFPSLLRLCGFFVKSHPALSDGTSIAPEFESIVSEKLKKQLSKPKI